MDGPCPKCGARVLSQRVTRARVGGDRVRVTCTSCGADLRLASNAQWALDEDIL